MEIRVIRVRAHSRQFSGEPKHRRHLASKVI